jgi:hypothetical protein
MAETRLTAYGSDAVEARRQSPQIHPWLFTRLNRNAVELSNRFTSFVVKKAFKPVISTATRKPAP